MFNDFSLSMSFFNMLNKKAMEKKKECVKLNQYETCINPNEIYYRGCTPNCMYYENAKKKEEAEEYVFVDNPHYPNLGMKIKKSEYESQFKELVEEENGVIYVKDEKLGGYTAYFKEISNVVTQAETKKEAYKNLINTLHDIVKYCGEKIVSEKTNLKNFLKYMRKRQLIVYEDEIIDDYLKEKNNENKENSQS